MNRLIRNSEVVTIDGPSLDGQASKSSLYELAHEGRVPRQKVGKYWRLYREAIDEWPASQASSHSSPSQADREEGVDGRL